VIENAMPLGFHLLPREGIHCGCGDIVILAARDQVLETFLM
jgi:hypothetical protein